MSRPIFFRARVLVSALLGLAFVATLHAAQAPGSDAGLPSCMESEVIRTRAELPPRTDFLELCVYRAEQGTGIHVLVSQNPDSGVQVIRQQWRRKAGEPECTVEKPEPLAAPVPDSWANEVLELAAGLTVEAWPPQSKGDTYFRLFSSSMFNTTQVEWQEDQNAGSLHPLAELVRLLLQQEPNSRQTGGQ